MMLKAFNMTLGVLMTFGVWGATLMLAILVAAVALHVLLLGGLTAWHLLR